MLIHCRNAPDCSAFYRLPDWVKLRRKQNSHCSGVSFSLRTHRRTTKQHPWLYLRSRAEQQDECVCRHVMDREPATGDVIIDKAMWHGDAKQDKEDLLKDGPASSGRGGGSPGRGAVKTTSLPWMKTPYPFPLNSFTFKKNLLKTWCNYSDQRQSMRNQRGITKLGNGRWGEKRERKREHCNPAHASQEEQHVCLNLISLSNSDRNSFSVLVRPLCGYGNVAVSIWAPCPYVVLDLVNETYSFFFSS